MSSARPASTVVLVGLSGSGKSTVGREAALRLGWQFVDLDSEIEHRTGITVSDIFSRHGEAFFRGLETDVSAELLNREEGHLVLAPGGGWITNPAALKLALTKSRTIYLKATPETALARLGTDTSARPLLRVSNPLAALIRLLREREGYYCQARSVIDTDVLDLQGVINEVVRLAGVNSSQ